MQSHEELVVWQKAVDLSIDLYSVTETFPAREMYGLSSQIRRAAISIPSNIAEGRRRGSDADFRNFLRIAHGSVAEIETHILISSRLGYCSEEKRAQVAAALNEVGKMLHAMIKRLQ
jgi:four helix bundle protein